MPVGRPTTLTDKVRAKVLEALRNGHSHPVAASIAGVPYNTLRGWISDGSREGSARLYSEFAAEVELACEAGLVDCERCLIQGGQQDPRIALAILQRRMRREWGNPVEVTGKDGGPVKVEAVGDLASALDALVTGAGSDGADRAE